MEAPGSEDAPPRGHRPLGEGGRTASDQQQDVLLFRILSGTLHIEQHGSALNLSRRHLYRCFVGAEDTVANLLLRRRLDTSIQLMESDPGLSLELIALRSGFSSGDQFRRAIRAPGPGSRSAWSA